MTYEGVAEEVEVTTDVAKRARARRSARSTGLRAPLIKFFNQWRRGVSTKGCGDLDVEWDEAFQKLSTSIHPTFVAAVFHPAQQRRGYWRGGILVSVGHNVNEYVDVFGT